MSKHKKSAKKQTKTLGDITINDYANSAVPCNRPKKSNSDVNTVMKQLNTEKSWDEKDYDELDYVMEENKDGSCSYVLKTVPKQNSDSSGDVKSDVGKDYSLDVWFLISEHINPEDVGRFSAICKTSYAVTNTAKFWIHLYKRFYKKVPNLPERLQPKCIFRLYGMRTSVIRSLYYMYSPFVNRYFGIRNEEHPSVLVRRQCVLMWHRKMKKLWIYYFKLKSVAGVITGQRRKPEKAPDLLKMLEDVSANCDEDCRILQITCENFFPVHPVQGLYLTSVGVTLSTGFRHNRVQMVFGSSVCYSKQIIDGSSCIGVLLDRAVSVKILDWWHPLYPHSNNMELLLNHE